jgi:surfactin synthase thioesterase subunit
MSHAKAVPRSYLRSFTRRPRPLIRLVCFPWCGAGASVYRKFAALLPEFVELHAVQLPGREDLFAEKKVRRMSELLDLLYPDMLAVMDLPVVFFGHSMGAVVAHEMAMRLRERIHREPAGLIVSGHRAPHLRLPDATRWHQADTQSLLGNLELLGGTPASILKDRALMKTYLPILQADYEVLETHRHEPRPPLSIPLIACAGVDDREVTFDGMFAWQTYTSKGFLLHWFNGDHFYLNDDPAHLAAQLATWLTPNGLDGIPTPEEPIHHETIVE